ncbi:MAG: NAD(P)/FAD-dependent oxidoreductase [Burkholderiaceae bacterium]
MVGCDGTLSGWEGKVFDAIIIGGGPAGVSCAVWLARLGFSSLLLEAEAHVGGLCRLNPFYDEWNAALPGVAGAQVAENLALSLEQAGAPARLLYRVGQIQRVGQTFAVTREDGNDVLHARRVVLATGVKARTLPELADGSVTELDAGCVLVGPGEDIVAYDFQRKRVAILGGGDNAFENALFAINQGALSVRIYARTIRAQQQFVRQVAASNIFLGDYRVDVAARTVNDQGYDVILVFYGWEPCVGLADGLALQRTNQGFIATRTDTAETSCEGVYAIGEVAQRQHPCVVTALADGVAAAKAIQARIEARGA